MGIFVQKAYDENDDKYQEKVREYEKEGKSREDAEDTTSEDLQSLYAKTLLEIYEEYMFIMNELKNSTYHRQIVEDTDQLMEEKFYDFDEALKIALRKNRRLFDELVADSDDESTDDSDVESIDQSDDE